MTKLILNENENNTYNIIQSVINGNLTQKEAMYELGRSRQQIYRLIKLYHSEGKKGFAHKNRGRKNPNKINQDVINELENLYLTEYYDYNFEAFYEEISDKYTIGYSTMVDTFVKHDILSPLCHKNTVATYNEKINKAIKEDKENISQEKIKLFQSRMIEFEKAHTRRSNNLYSFGQEVQMDACEKIWFSDIVSYLHLAVDKGTKKVLFGWFEYEEITRGYYVLLFHILINYGIPEKIKADNRSTFAANNAKDKLKKVFLTQFGKVCELLNITLETTSVATSKPNVERANGTFKNRLIAELRHEGIDNIDDANDYLNKKFIPKINNKFSYAINEKTSKMRKNNYTEEELYLIISEKYNRIIDNASSIKYNNKYYVPIDSETGKIVCYMKGTECQLIVDYNGEYWCKIECKYYKLLELETRDSIMFKEKDLKQTKEKEQHKYTPPKNHPWRKNMMLR